MELPIPTLIGLGGGDSEKKLKILVAGAHPDDPETGAGGTIARYTALGHEVVMLYLTRGEAGIKGESPDEAARIRTRESEKAAAILQAQVRFVGQIDGATEITRAHYAEVRAILEEEKPDIVLNHWPVDTHRDHRNFSQLVYDAWLNLEKPFVLYYYEVCSRKQTRLFEPTHYVNIAATRALKQKASYVHASQNIRQCYSDCNVEMEEDRGRESGVKAAEAFILSY